MVILVYSTYKVHTEKWLGNLINYLRQDGHKVLVRNAPISLAWLNLVLPWIDHVFLWNGDRTEYKILKQIANRLRVTYTVVEVGFFPQKSTIVFDRKGINANSELINDPLDWVTETHLNNLGEFKQSYLKGLVQKDQGDYILCPLQLEKDTNIQEHSPYKSMQKFITVVESEFPDETILFKPHPLDEATRYSCKASNKIVKNQSILALAQNAKLVYGINSTSLLETALMGVPTKAIGDGYLKTHSENQETLLAALVDKQAPIDSEDFSYWLELYAGIGTKKQTTAVQSLKYIMATSMAHTIQILQAQLNNRFSFNFRILRALNDPIDQPDKNDV